MGRLERAVADGVAVGVASEALSTTTTRLSTSSTSCQSSSPDTKHTPTSSQPLPPSSSSSSSSSTHIPRNHLSSIPVPIKSSSSISPSNTSGTSSSIPKIGSVLAMELPSGRVVQEHRSLPQQSPSTPRDYVTIFLLENNSLLSASVNQMKQEKQVCKYKSASESLTKLLLRDSVMIRVLFPPAAEHDCNS